MNLKRFVLLLLISACAGGWWWAEFRLSVARDLHARLAVEAAGQDERPKERPVESPGTVAPAWQLPLEPPTTPNERNGR